MKVSEASNISPNQQLEEKISNMHEQLAGATSRLDQTERDLDLERATREDIIKAEVERRMAEAEKRIRAEIEAEYSDERIAIDKEKKAIDQQREDMLKSFEQMQQKLIEETEQKIKKAKDDAESHFLAKMASQMEGFLRLFSEMTSRKNADIQEYLSRFKAASEEAQTAIAGEIKSNLEKIFKNEKSKNRQIAELVRMIFTQKRERFIISEDDRTTLHEKILASLELTDKQKEEYKQALEAVRKYRLQKEADRLARQENHQDVCDALAPLYRLQEQYVMNGRYLAADGSPMPVVDNEKHRTVKQYIIEYRNIDTGIPIFLTTLGKGCGRGKEVIQTQLSNWSGLALICDAYPGYDWLKKVGRVLCRCSTHARRDHERAMKENPKGAMPGMLLFQEIYAVEEIIKHEEAKGSRIAELRNEIARPLWETFHMWCLNEILKYDQNSQMYKALNYVIRHYDELTAYLDIPEMPLDNNDTYHNLNIIPTFFVKTCHKVAA